MSQADTDYSRAVWRLDATSMIYHHLVNVTAQHQLIDEHNTTVEHIPSFGERERQRIPIGPLTVRCWILVCMFSSTLMWTIGLPDARVFGGQRPLDVAAPLAYITRLHIALHERRSHEIRVHMTITRSSLTDKVVFTFHFDGPTMEDLHFFHTYVVPALLHEEGECLGNTTRYATPPTVGQ